MLIPVRSSILISLIVVGACSGGGSGSGGTVETAAAVTEAALEATEEQASEEESDTTGAVVSTAGALCDYTDTTFNNQSSLTYTSTSSWTCTDSTRELNANGVPDHEVGTFPNPGNPNTITEQVVSASYPLLPAQAGSATGLGGPAGVTGFLSTSSN